MKTVFHFALMCLCTVLAACGGGGSGSSTQKLIVIGNSLTYHPPLPQRGWVGDWGMAASSQARDFAHLTGAALDIEVSPHSFIALERGDVGALEQIAGYAALAAGNVVVVELGDNVAQGGTNAFAPRYTALLDALRPSGRLVCLSTWWRVESLDTMMRAACTVHGGTFVYIGDLFPVRLDDVGTFSDRNVDLHPHDWGMAQIATRVLAALRT